MEAVGTLGYPFQLRPKSESLAHAMLRFGSGKTAVLHCHYTDIPMYPIPFFQIFGDKVSYLLRGVFTIGDLTACQQFIWDSRQIVTGS